MNMFRFPTKLSLVLVVAGSLMALGGFVLALKYFVLEQGTLRRLGFALLFSVAGLIVIAFGEIVGVAFAIEETTRRTDECAHRQLELIEQYVAAAEEPSKPEEPPALPRRFIPD